MRFAEALNQAPTAHKRGLHKIIDELSPDDAADLQSALSDQQITGASIARALKRMGHQVHQSTVNRYRESM